MIQLKMKTHPLLQKNLNKFLGVDLLVVRAMKRMVLDQDPEQEAEARILRKQLDS